MDAEGVDQAVISGLSEGGIMALYFAATHPERTSGLMLLNTSAGGTGTTEPFLQWLDLWAEHWGTPETITVPMFMPSKLGDPDYLRWVNRHERMTSTPANLKAMMLLNAELDVRHVLPTIHVPSVVIHREHEALVPLEEGRYLAEHIPGARLAVVPGQDHLPWLGGIDPILEEIEGVPHRHEAPRRAGPRPGHDPVHGHRRLDEDGGEPGRPALEGGAGRARHARPPGGRPLPRASS